MKKFLLTLLALVWVSAAAFAGEYTIQFKGNGTSDSSTAFSQTKSISTFVESGAEYLSTIKSVSKVYQAKEGYGMKFSSASAPGNITFALTTDGCKKISKIVATLAAYNNAGDLAAAAMAINGVSQDVRDADLLEYTFEYPEAAEVTTLEFVATKRVYVQKLVVTYEEEQTGPTYETYPADINSTHGERYTTKLTFDCGGATQEVTDLQTGLRQPVYQDAVAQVVTFNAGSTVTVTADFHGSWMHGYLWVDYNNDGIFTADLDGNDIPTATSELVGFTCYNRDEAGSWHASDGTTFADGGGNANANQPIKFTLPADLAPGDYRARFIVDWNAIEPNPDPNRTDNKLENNGGIIADFTIHVEAAAATLYTVTIVEPEDGTLEVLADGATVVNSGDQVEAGTELTFTATPAEGYEFTGLYINDVVKSINNPFVVNEDVTILATFYNKYYDITYTTPENGALNVTCDGVAVASGDRLAHGSVLTITATPAEGYELATLTVNGAALEGNTLTLTENAAIAATFTEASQPGVEYTAPSGNSYPNNYVESISTTGATTDISQNYFSHPGSIYNVFETPIVASAGSDFTLNLTAYSEGPSGTSGIEDMRYNIAYFFVDWYGTGTFSFLQAYGNHGATNNSPDNNVIGNYDDVMEIAHVFSVPADVADGTAARIRVIYSNAWTGLGQATVNGGNPDPNATNLEKGIAYDFIVNVEGAAAPKYTVNFAAPENGTLTVLNGETVINSGDQVEENTELTITATPAEGYQLATLTANDAAIEGNTLTVTEDVTIAATFTAVPVVEQRASFTIPETTGNTNTQLYAFRFDDAPLGSHTNGSVDDNDLRSRNFTYSAWLRIKSADGKPIMGNIQTDFSHACGAFLVTYSDGKLNFNGRNADANSTNFKDVQGSATTDEGTAIDEWVFVSVVADQANNTVTLYKNGKAISSYATGYGIGLLGDKSSFFVCDNGASVELSEVQLWNKALTADELKDAYAFSYNANAVPENLVAYYRAGDFVEGSTKALRNLGTEATTPAELLLGTYRISGWSPYFASPVAQDITVDGEGHVYKTVAVTAVQPEQEGCSFKITGNNGRAIETEANLYEKLTVVPTLAEGVQLNGVKVVEGTTTTTYTLEQMPFYANGDITVSLDFGTEVPNMYTVTFVAPENGTLEVLNGETVINSGDQVEENTVLTITATPAEGYELATLTANDAAIEGNTLTVTEDVTIAATFAEAGQSYEIFDPTIRMTNGGRYTENITLMSEGQTQTISNLQSNASDYVYKDATDQVATFYAGKTVTATAGYNGSWMHGYLWIDYNKDYQFTPDMDENDIPTATSELVGFTCYNRDEAGSWHASDGTTFADGGGNANADQPIKFTLPADLAPGDYRARFIVDWNAIEPNPDPNRSNNKIQANGGIIADFTIRIVEKNSFKVVANVTGGAASIEINGEGGFQDLPAEGMTVAKGAKVAVRFVPAASHYDLTSFEVNGVDDLDHMASLSQTIYSIPSVTEDYTFNAVYTARKHTLTVINPQDADPMQSWFGEFRDNNNEPLDMLTETTTEVEEGTSVFFVVMPPLEAAEEGEYELETVTDNGADVKDDMLPMEEEQWYIMGGITEDHTLVVTQSISGIIAISSDANNALKLENDILTIAADDAVIEVADINGRVLRKAQTSAMEVSDLVKGVYVAKAVTADATYTLKFIKL